MRTVHLYASGEGWVYEVWIGSLLRVVGFFWNRDDAQREAEIA